MAYFGVQLPIYTFGLALLTHAMCTKATHYYIYFYNRKIIEDIVDVKLLLVTNLI